MKNQSENEMKKIENDKINVMGRNVTRGWAGRGGGREGGIVLGSPTILQ